jgi:CHASE3 domain sensor protein
MKGLAAEAQILQDLIRRYSSREIAEILPDAIDSYLGSPELGEHITEEARQYLQKMSPNFKEKFLNQVVSSP